MSDERFRRIATLLLGGGFINRQNQPALFDYLDTPGNLETLSAYLGQLGLVPAQTSSQQTWYAALAGLTEDNRSAARETAATAKRELRHWVAFLKLTLVALDEPAPSAGATLHAHRLLTAVNDNLNLQETLRTLAQRLRSTPDASIQAALDAVLRWALHPAQGLIELIDEHKSTYRLTGKVDWVIDMIQAFDESLERSAGPARRTSAPRNPAARNLVPRHPAPRST